MVMIRIAFKILLALSVGTTCGLVAGAQEKSKTDKQSSQGQQQSNAGQQKPGGTAAAPQPTPDEIKQLQLIQNELDPDRQVELVNEFEKKFPTSPLLTYAYFMAAAAYQQKNEPDRIIEYGEKSLKLNADNLSSLILMASMLPQPQFLR